MITLDLQHFILKYNKMILHNVITHLRHNIDTNSFIKVDKRVGQLCNYLH